MSSFPDVLSADLDVWVGQSSIKPTFTVPAEYAFAVVQVCLIFENNSGSMRTLINTSHGSFSFDNYNNNNDASTLKDFPILNLIIKGGESFSLLSSGPVGGGSLNYKAKAKVTALCHKKPS